MTIVRGLAADIASIGIALAVSVLALDAGYTVLTALSIALVLWLVLLMFRKEEP